MKARRNPICIALPAIVLAAAMVASPNQAHSEEGGLTFFGWSDQHVQTNGDGSHLVPAIEAMNALAGTPYPGEVGGTVGEPAFVLGCGDITEWPTHAAIKTYEELITKRLKYPSFDVAGNHDEGGKVPSLTAKNWLIARHGSLSYTFDRGGVRFIMVFSKYDETLNNPAQPITKEAIEFVRQELAKLPEGRPAIVATHLCFDAMTNRDELIEAIGDANVILILGGHYHKAKVNEYRGFHFVQLPSPAPNSRNEVTVIRVAADRLTAVPFDYDEKKWSTQPGRFLNVQIRGPMVGKVERDDHTINEHAPGIVGLALVSCALGMPGTAPEDAPQSLLVRHEVMVDPEAWKWNWSSWDQEKILTFGSYQYTVYWDADRVFVLVRRDLRSDEVQTVRLPEFKLSSDDRHRNTCLAASAADGRLHLSWDHHNNQLRYARSRAGLLTDPPAELCAGDVEPAGPMLSDPALESRVTYPRFLNDRNGALFFTYRVGASGNGNNYLHRYDPSDGSWTRLGKLFSSQGTYGPWEASKSRCAYLHDLLFDRRNRLHATWVYRETGASWASNHDLHYAYSDDRGMTWHNNAGNKIADLAKGDPIELDDPGIVVREIPVYSWLMNAGCMALAWSRTSRG